MSLPRALRQVIDNPKLDPGQRAAVRCQISKRLEDAGDYEQAREALGDLWPGPGADPRTSGLEPATAAELTLRAGVLTGWLGSTSQAPGAQEAAKDLISRALGLFEVSGAAAKVAECRLELSICYWREAAVDEAFIQLEEARAVLRESDRELKIRVELFNAQLHRAQRRYHESLRTLNDVAPDVQSFGNHYHLGKLHNGLAMTLEIIGNDERRPDYIDRAIIEYTAANFHFDQIKHTRYVARVENNLGLLFYTLSRYADAHNHLRRARNHFTALRDAGAAAQVEDTMARALLDEGKLLDAEHCINSAVATFEKGGEAALLAGALRTKGVVLARSAKREPAMRTLRRALSVAAEAGARHEAALAALTIVEELHEDLTYREARSLFDEAEPALRATGQPATLGRLLSCARLLLDMSPRAAAHDEDQEFVHASPLTCAIVRRARRAAASSETLLITGESGTGKSTLAALVHAWGGLSGPLTTVDCPRASAGQLPELIGNTRGGTLLLEEIDALDKHSQRLLANQLGGSDVRVIATTASDADKLVESGAVLGRLWDCLTPTALHLPPLHERPEDTPALARHFIAEALAEEGKDVHFTEEAVEAMYELRLSANAWDLRRIIERTVAEAPPGTRITTKPVRTLAGRQTHDATLLDPWENFHFKREVTAYEDRLIKQALRDGDGSITRAARLLRLKSPSALQYRLENRNRKLLGERSPRIPRNTSHGAGHRRRRSGGHSTTSAPARREEQVTK